jgi:hypothetical protein
MASILETLRDQLRGRIQRRAEKRDPEERTRIPVEFRELPAGAERPRDLFTECDECHCVVLKASILLHEADHLRWAEAILANRYYDGPRRPDPPRGYAVADPPPP